MQTHSCKINWRREKSLFLAQLQMPQGRQKMSNTKITLKHCSSHGQRGTSNASRMLKTLASDMLEESLANANSTCWSHQSLLCY